METNKWNDEGVPTDHEVINTKKKRGKTRNMDDHSFHFFLSLVIGLEPTILTNNVVLSPTKYDIYFFFLLVCVCCMNNNHCIEFKLFHFPPPITCNSKQKLMPMKSQEVIEKKINTETFLCKATLKWQCVHVVGHTHLCLYVWSKHMIESWLYNSDTQNQTDRCIPHFYTKSSLHTQNALTIIAFSFTYMPSPFMCICILPSKTCLFISVILWVCLFVACKPPTFCKYAFHDICYHVSVGSVLALPLGRRGFSLSYDPLWWLYLFCIWIYQSCHRSHQISRPSPTTTSHISLT